MVIGSLCVSDSTHNMGFQEYNRHFDDYNTYGVSGINEDVILKGRPYRPTSRVVIGREVDYRSRLIYVRYCLTNTTLCL